MGKRNAVCCPKCHHTFVADHSAEIECPVCQTMWKPASLSPATLMPSEPQQSTTPVPYLVMTSPSGTRRVLELRQDCTVIGRADDCDIVISDDKVGRYHARLELRDGFCTLIDENSVNGTFVGKERIRERVLVRGERFRIGTMSFSYRAPNKASTPYGLAYDEIEGQPTRGLGGWIRSTRSVLVAGWRARKEIDRLDHQAAESANRASELEKRQEEIVVKLGRRLLDKSHADRFPDISNALRDNRSQREEMSRRQAALNKDKAACESQIAALKAEHTPSITRAKQAVAEKNQAVQRCTADIAQLDAACNSKRRVVEQLSAEVQRTRPSQQPQDAAKRAGLQQRLSRVTHQARSDEDRLNALRHDLAAAQRAIEAPQHSLRQAQATLREALAPHEQTLGQLRTELDRTASKLHALSEREQELVKELGRAASSVKWDDPELAGLTADRESTGQKASRMRSSAETDARQCDRLRPVVKRLKMRLLMLGGGGLALVLVIVMGMHLLSGPIQPGSIDYARIRENVGLVVVYGTYQAPNGTLFDDTPQGTGSCFAVTEDGFLLTARHVTRALRNVPSVNGDGWPRIGPAKIAVCFGSDKRRHFSARVVHECSQFDAAVLKVQHSFPSYFELSPQSEPGKVAYICGFPSTAQDFVKGQENDFVIATVRQKFRNGMDVVYSDYFSDAVFEVSVTRGVISAKPLVAKTRYLQTDVQAQHGNSGGPMMLSDEKVVGILVGIIVHHDVATGTNYAIEITQLKSDLAPYVKLK